MSASEAYYSILVKVRQDGNYVFRDYETIGGMWTVDTWQLQKTKYCLTDSDDWIYHPTVHVWRDYSNEFHYKNGTETDLINLANLHLSQL